jgi:hypothetical protein
MKRTAITLALVLALLFSIMAVGTFVNMARANFMISLPTIEIQSDGSIVPETEYMHQAGNVYTLTTNLSQQYAIKIKCSNIIFDGNGYVLNGTLPDPAYGARNYGLSLEGVNNVTVRGLWIIGFDTFDVSIVNCSACVVLRVKANSFNIDNSSLNVISESSIAGIYQKLQPAILMSFSNNNEFYRNNITNLILDDSTNNMFFENNFVSTIFSIDGNNLWDNGSVGNYWTDYSTKYPNASEIGSSGMGDTQYVIDANNIDHYPFISPFVTTLPPEPQPSEPFPTALVITASGASVAMVGVGLLVYFKKHKRGVVQE